MRNGWFSASLLALLTLPAAHPQPSRIIVTVAGNGSGDGGAAGASSLSLSAPNSLVGLAVGPSGVMYVAERANNRIREVTAGGILITVAGTTVPGYSGDNGPATQAQLNMPGGIALDAGGDLYIADSANNVVRKLLPDGTIITVAGTGAGGYNGDGGPANQAMLFDPENVVLDSAGNLYIACSSGNVVRKLTLDGKISTVAGNGTVGFSGDGGPAVAAQLSLPTGLAVDPAGVLYISDSNNYRVRKVTTDGKIATVTGNGTICYGTCGDGGMASAAQIYHPRGLAFDSAGNLYIADIFNSTIRRITTDGKISTYMGKPDIYGFAGDGGQLAGALLYEPTNMAFDGQGNLYVSDDGNNRIREVTTTGLVSTAAGNGNTSFLGDGGPATKAQFNEPASVAVDSFGDLFIADTFDNRIREVLPDGTVTTVAGNGIAGFTSGGLPTASELFAPIGIAFNPSGTLFISDTLNSRIRRLDPGSLTEVAGTGVTGFSGDNGPAPFARLYCPMDMVFDSAGNLYFADFLEHRVRKIDTGGTISTVAGNGIQAYSDDGGPATAASLSAPYGVALDGAGNLYIADQGANVVRMVTPGGVISTVAGTGTAGYSGDGGPATAAQLNNPAGLAFDSLGNLYIADQDNNRVREVDHASSFITTVAGTGAQGDSGDNGPAALAQLTAPTGVALDQSGNLYITGMSGHIRKVFTPPVALQTSPAGLLVSVDGASPVAAPLWFDWTPGSQHTIAAASPQPGTPGVRYEFLNWSDGGALAHTVTVPTSPTTYTATFDIQYLLETVASPTTGGTTTVYPPSADGYYDAGELVKVTAQPVSGYYFSNWGQNPTANANPISFAMDDAYVATATFSMFSFGLPDMTVYLSHSGSFNLGGTGTLTVTASNIGFWDPATGLVTVTDTVPAGLAIASVNGSAWTCGTAGQIVTCTRSDGLASGLSFPVIIIGVNVTANAPATAINTATVSGGGDTTPGNDTASDTITFGAPDLTISVTHSGTFAPFGSGVYTVTVSNISTNTATSGQVTVTDTIPTGITVTSATGTGWSCGISGQTVTCTCSNTLAAGAAYPPIAINLSMAAGVPLEISNTVSVSGGGDLNPANNAATDTLDLSGIISTVAGGYTGGGYEPTAISIYGGVYDTTPMMVDPAGSLYFGGDWLNPVVMKWTPGGLVTVVAGNGSQDQVGYGDGGAAIAAAVVPTAVAMDKSGNLCIATRGAIRQVTPGGIVSTFAGTGQPGYGGDNGPATQAQVYEPAGLAVDSAGNVYIGDTGNYRVRRVDAVTGIITTIAGTGSICTGTCGDGGPASAAGLYTIRGLAIDSSDNLYISDGNNCRIRKIDHSSGIINTVAGAQGGISACIEGTGDGTPAVGAQLFFPMGIALDSSGNLFIADEFHNSIRRVDAVTGIISTVAGNGTSGFSGDGGPATAAQLQQPCAVVVDGFGNLYIGDNQNNRIRKVTPGGTILTVMGNGTPFHVGEGGPATQAQLNSPAGVATDTAGNLYIADQNHNMVRKVSPSGVITTLAGIGQSAGADTGNGGPATAAEISFPISIAADPFGNVYFGESEGVTGSGDCIRKVTPAGIISTLPLQVYGGGVLTTDSAGNLYTADWMGQRVYETLASNGLTSSIVGTGSPGYSGDGNGAAVAQLNSPGGVAVDSKGNLYIADTNNNVIRRVDAVTRIITTIAGNGQPGYTGDGGPASAALLHYPGNLAIDPGGDLFFLQPTEGVIRKITPAGTISTVAGNGTVGYSGDGGYAVMAKMDSPGYLATDAAGNLYITDVMNNRIRKVSWAPTTLVTIDTSPTGLPVTIDGAALVVPQTLSWVPGTSHTVSVAAQQPIGTGSRYAFADWSDGQAPSHTIVAPAAATSYIAGFTTQYQLTLTGTPTGGGTVAADPASADGYYNSGTSVEILAQGIAPLAFSSFSGDLGGQTSPQSVVMTVPRSVTASFAVPPALGAINVSNNIAAAGFTLSGPAAYSGSGTWWFRTGAPTGAYTITYSAVSGYTTPAPQTQTLAAGGSITFTAAYTNAAAIVVSGGGTQSATVNTGFSSPLQVTVTDANGNPVAGVTVSFSAPTSGAGATLSSASAITNSSGIASVTATANGVAGSYTVTATAGPLAASFALLNASKCDINQDGIVNVVDVQREINEALGVSPAVHDLNGDGVVNVVDVQIVINAALGLGCTAK